jgi:hypothetical protein
MYQLEYAVSTTIFFINNVADTLYGTLQVGSQNMAEAKQTKATNRQKDFTLTGVPTPVRILWIDENVRPPLFVIVSRCSQQPLFVVAIEKFGSLDIVGIWWNPFFCIRVVLRFKGDNFAPLLKGVTRCDACHAILNRHAPPSEGPAIEEQCQNCPHCHCREKHAKDKHKMCATLHECQDDTFDTVKTLDGGKRFE